jgi:gentisate 1,2-dioxygenase
MSAPIAPQSALHSAVQAERKAYYQRIAGLSMTPLWEVLHALVPAQPASPCQPALWRYADVRPFLLESGQLITALEAERRVLILENPGMPGSSCTTHSLYAGLQLILPGEVAPAHRHTQTALRFVVEGLGAYTAVDGERTTMHPGDFIITPSWTWHDHGNPSDEPMVWLDGLDIPIVAFFDAGFMQRSGEQTQREARPQRDAENRYGANLLPYEYESRSLNSPLFSYPYERSREALEQLRRDAAWHPSHGLKMQYVNPATGGYPMPTIAAFIQLLPRGFQGQAYRSTDATVFCCIEGSGLSRIGGKEFAWGPRDIFVVPSWVSVSHHPAQDCVLFSFSDRPAQKSLGLWREELLA